MRIILFTTQIRYKLFDIFYCLLVIFHSKGYSNVIKLCMLKSLPNLELCLVIFIKKDEMSYLFTY